MSTTSPPPRREQILSCSKESDDKGRRQQEGLANIRLQGGGINGTGIANDAAGRGLSVTLCEQADLAHAIKTGELVTHAFCGTGYIEVIAAAIGGEHMHHQQQVGRCLLSDHTEAADRFGGDDYRVCELLGPMYD